MWAEILTVIGCAITIIGFVYGFLRNFKSDIKQNIGEQLSRMEKRIDTLEERMFWLATGKTLDAAILEEKMKQTQIKK